MLDGLTPRDWYRLLNNRAFFWPSEERLLRLLGARAYRIKRHDILEVDAEAIFRDFSGRITLSPINSGSTLFNPSPRGKQTFSRIKERPIGNRVAEISIDHSVPNIADYVSRVVKTQGDKVIQILKD